MTTFVVVISVITPELTTEISKPVIIRGYCGVKVMAVTVFVIMTGDRTLSRKHWYSRTRKFNTANTRAHLLTELILF
jgi:hypothetical protein